VDESRTITSVASAEGLGMLKGSISLVSGVVESVNDREYSVKVDGKRYKVDFSVSLPRRGMRIIGAVAGDKLVRWMEESEFLKDRSSGLEKLLSARASKEASSDDENILSVELTEEEISDFATKFADECLSILKRVDTKAPRMYRIDKVDILREQIRVYFDYKKHRETLELIESLAGRLVEAYVAKLELERKKVELEIEKVKLEIEKLKSSKRSK